jgi:NTP pyrophosphatase (non-canonical NTP hydrolase)
MHLSKYQSEAGKTSQPSRPDEVERLKERIVPLLGLAGEAGQLLSEYKKFLRDGPAHLSFRERVSEELGDLLWYVADVATEFDLDLGEIASANLEKIHQRWVNGRQSGGSYRFDSVSPKNEQLPRQFEITITEDRSTEPARVVVFHEGKQIGNELTDNSAYPDGYRFHDVFHLAHAAVLGWSPVARSMLKAKRKTDPTTDEVQDGGRAIAIEEGVTALIFSYAEGHDLLRDVSTVDFGLLKTVKYMTDRLEVAACTTGDWEKAILLGYDIWHKVCDHRGGRLAVDIDAQTLEFAPPETIRQ